MQFYRSDIYKILFLGAVTVGGVVAYHRFWPSDYQPEVVVQPVAATSLRPFVIGPSTCVGRASQRVQVEASRENDARIPLPLLPDVPIPLPGQDRYHVNVVLESDLCVDGIDGIGDGSPIHAVTTGDGITVTVNQAAGVFTMEPRVNATNCTTEQWAANDPCMSIGGGPSNGTKLIELLPFTASGNNLTQQALAAAQVYAYNPECLSHGFDSISGSSFYDVLLATFQWQAQQQGLAVDSVKLVLLDRDGKPTTKWDDSAQRELFDAQRARLAATLPDGGDLKYTNDCDVSTFGIAAPNQKAVALPNDSTEDTSGTMGGIFPAVTVPENYVTVPSTGGDS